MMTKTSKDQLLASLNNYADSVAETLQGVRQAIRTDNLELAVRLMRMMSEQQAAMATAMEGQ